MLLAYLAGAMIDPITWLPALYFTWANTGRNGVANIGISVGFTIVADTFIAIDRGLPMFGHETKAFLFSVLAAFVWGCLLQKLFSTRRRKRALE